jgi:hypothetical protein
LDELQLSATDKKPFAPSKERKSRRGVAGNSIEEERSDGRESDVNKGNEPMRIAS